MSVAAQLRKKIEEIKQNLLLDCASGGYYVNELDKILAVLATHQQQLQSLYNKLKEEHEEYPEFTTETALRGLEKVLAGGVEA